MKKHFSFLKSIFIYNIFLICNFMPSCINIAGGDSSVYTLKAELPNSSDVKKVLKYEGSHGATVGNTINLSVAGRGDTLNKNPTYFFSSYRDSVAVKWINDTVLLVKYPKSLTVFKSDSESNGVKIRYENLIIKDNFDSSKKPKLDCENIRSVELLLGDWKWLDKRWAFQENSKIVVRDRTWIDSVCTALKSSKLIKGRSQVHVYWLVLNLQTKNEDAQFVMQRDAQNNFWFDYRNERYEGKRLAELLSGLLEAHYRGVN